MFCPQCRTEYREGFTVCADCGVPLVGNLPPEAAPDHPAAAAGIDDHYDESEFKTFLVAATSKELTLAKCALLDAGIPFMVKSRDMTGGTASDVENIYGTGLPAIIEVPEDYLKDAYSLFSPPESRPDPEIIVRELEQSFIRNLLTYALFLAAALALAYSLMPDMMEEGPKIVIYCLAGYAAVVLGNALRFIRQLPSDIESQVNFSAYPDIGRKRKLKARIAVNFILFVIAGITCGILFYFYGWGIDNVPTGKLGELSRGKIERIAGFYQRKLEKDPANIAYLCMIGEAHNDLSKYGKSLMYFNRAIVIDPGNEDCRYGRGLVYFNMGDYSKAEKDFTFIIDSGRKYTGSADAYYARGNSFIRSGYYAKAIEDYDKAILRDPGYAKAYHMRARAYSTFLGNCGKALQDLDQALKIQSDEPYFLNSTAQILASCPDKTYRDGQKAVKYALDALRKKDPSINPNDTAGFYSTAAAAYAESGNFKEAARYQQKAYELYTPLDPQDKTKDVFRETLGSYINKNDPG